MPADLTPQFTEAKKAYPRQVWSGGSLWKLVDCPTLPGLLILQETPAGAASRTHGKYTIWLQDLMQQKGA